jgi:hypothetical protein
MYSDSTPFRAAEPKRNTPLNLVLTICFAGIFCMLVGSAAIAVVLVGRDTFASNFVYLLYTALYLGSIVIALVAATFTFNLPELKIYRIGQRSIFLPPSPIEIDPT